MDPPNLTVACLFTTFPKPTETFLQREVAALQALGVNLRLYSLHGGGGVFRGLPVRRFSKMELLKLLWLVPREAAWRPEVLGELVCGVLSRRPRSWLNFWENLLGAGFACVCAREFRRNPPDLVHAAWAGAPAAAAWLLWRLTGLRYSLGAHAYDLYEHGGDGWLMEKIARARFVHTSTEMGRRTLLERGGDERKIFCIRRGLEKFPPCKPLRAPRNPLRIVGVARFVAKKGLGHQLRIYAALKAAGFGFEARLIGDGPQRGELEGLVDELDLRDRVSLPGFLPASEIFDQLAWADVLVHTGVVAPSGDRDGLPNVIAEAMAAGVLVVTSPAAAATEAIQHEVTGLVAGVEEPGAWVVALQRLRDEDVLARRLRAAARSWAEENFDAHRNAAHLLALMRAAVPVA